MLKALLASISLVGAAASLAAVSAVVACDDGTASASTNFGPLLRTLTETVILPANSAFAARADDLSSALVALQSAPTSDSLRKAQSAWRAARAAFRSLDAVHFGPVADLSITERIDLSPASAPDIDALVAATTPIDAGVVGAAGGKSKGFLGLEYLLFAKEGDAAALAKLRGASPAERRRDLARAMSAEIATSAHQLADAWTLGKGGYAGELENAGAGSARYPTQRAAVDDVVGGASYALEVVVGVRLASPLGLGGTGTPDPTRDPTTTSDCGIADMTVTLAGVKALYQGQGVSAQIRPKTAVLDDRVVAQLGDCASKLTAIPPPFAISVTNDTGAVRAAYDSCKALKATWNTDVTSAIGATLKPGDNDGD